MVGLVCGGSGVWCVVGLGGGDRDPGGYEEARKDYVLQQLTESHGLTNTLYTGRWIMRAASCSL